MTLDEALAWQADRAEIKRLQAENEKLRAALAPFAVLARSIPDNWPGDCCLREDSEWRVGRTNWPDGWHHWLAYWGVNDGRPMLPTIREWREAARAAGGKDVRT